VHRRVALAVRMPQIWSDGAARVSSPPMAKHSASILELARRGAQHRYEELQGELASLVRQFPDLRRGAREIVRRGRRAGNAAVAERRPRKRRKMNAAARARIAAAQRARWAKQKAAAGTQAEAAGPTAGKKR
jgi:hypothetical protein